MHDEFPNRRTCSSTKPQQDSAHSGREGFLEALQALGCTDGAKKARLAGWGLCTRLFWVMRRGYDLVKTAQRVAVIYKIDMEDIYSKGKQRKKLESGAYFAIGSLANWVFLSRS